MWFVLASPINILIDLVVQFVFVMKMFFIAHSDGQFVINCYKAVIYSFLVGIFVH